MHRETFEKLMLEETEANHAAVMEITEKMNMFECIG